MTKVEAVKLFRDIVNVRDYKDDKIALREEWNSYVDMLCNDGYITEKQCDTWVSPF